ncbi:MAG: acyltransferase [Clostridia bacterium]|nr:acyltransferase [Clostridia bacterium]
MLNQVQHDGTKTKPINKYTNSLTYTTMRRHDIDWLRVITIGLLLIYHIAIVFQPFGYMIGFMQNHESWRSLWIPMSMINIWRIPVLFFVSGMGVCFAIRKRNWKQLIKERSLRIFVPFLFGMLAITPLHIYLFQSFYDHPIAYKSGQGHLWFLLNIFIYVLILSPLFFYLKNNKRNKFIKVISRVFKTPFGLLIIVACFLVENQILQPQFYTLYAFTLHGYILGFIAFFFGFLIMQSGDNFWNNVLKYRWLYFSIAILLYSIRLIIYRLEAPAFLQALESPFWIFAVFGFSYKHLNRAGNTLSYLSKAAYPVYIIHMVVLFLTSYFVLPMNVIPQGKFFIICGTTFAICFIVYEFLIRRVKFVRPLFGLKV